MTKIYITCTYFIVLRDKELHRAVIPQEDSTLQSSHMPKQTLSATFHYFLALIHRTLVISLYPQLPSASEEILTDFEYQYFYSVEINIFLALSRSSSLTKAVATEAGKHHMDPDISFSSPLFPRTIGFMVEGMQYFSGNLHVYFQTPVLTSSLPCG